MISRSKNNFLKNFSASRQSPGLQTLFFFIFSLIYSHSNLNLSFSASNTSKWISHVSLFLISISRLLYRYTSPGIWGTGTCSLACSVFWFFRLGLIYCRKHPKSIMRTMNDGMIYYLSVAVEAVSIPPSMPSSEGFLQGRSTWPRAWGM